MNYSIGNGDAALGFFEEAARIAPDDAIPLTNIAYIRYEQGDTAQALEIYRKIENGSYDEESRGIARQMIDAITSPVNTMDEYFYFFRFLPQVAAQVKNPVEFMEVTTFNTHIPAFNKLRSPFADADIKAEKAEPQEGESEVVVWTFPMPHEIPMCRYMAFVADGKGGCRVLTLEKSIEDYWVVGTMIKDGHTNFGSVAYPDDAAAFVNTLRQKQLLTPRP